jgi:predicted enzyme related to lactoylglutathione lyase
MLRGLTTVAYQTADLEAAKRWYSQVLGIEPYHNRTEYAEFRIGDYEHELGLIDTQYLPDLGGGGDQGPAAPGGAIVYWHVDDVPATLERLVELGATVHHPPRDFGEQFVGASVIDPFGNVLGIMQNPHYLEVLGTRKP